MRSVQVSKPNGAFEVGETYESMMSGKVRFSAVLTTTGHQGFESITIVLLCLLCVVANKRHRQYENICILLPIRRYV